MSLFLTKMSLPQYTSEVDSCILGGGGYVTVPNNGNWPWSSDIAGGWELGCISMIDSCNWPRSSVIGGDGGEGSEILSMGGGREEGLWFFQNVCCCCC